MNRLHYHVVAAVIENPQGDILLARRLAHQDQGGLWEFPGGKVEVGEEPVLALSRELDEELGIQLRRAHPLISIPWHYPQHSVQLEVWRVTAFDGEPHGAEGQVIKWVAAQDLGAYRFPAANRAIVTAAQLPPFYHITPEPGAHEHWPAFLAQLECTLAKGARLVQLRAKSVNEQDYAQLAGEVIRHCHQQGAQCLLNASPELVQDLGADGVHLDSARLMQSTTRPLPQDYWVAASCHTLNELRHAEAIDASFALMSPVKATASHPGVEGVGWQRFAELAARSPIPLYALGGMERGDETVALQHGGQGIAAIRALWG